MKKMILSLLLLGAILAEEDEIQSKELEDSLKSISDGMSGNYFKLQTELKSKMKRIENMIDMTFSAISDESLRNSWREGVSVQRDVDFDAAVVFYKLKEINKFPCKNINFLFNIKTDLEVYTYNANRFMSCWLRFNNENIKALLSDVVVEGVVNILKSGYSNPISTFFSNILIVEGPQKLKDELFAVFNQYYEENEELSTAFSKFKDIVLKVSFDPELYKEEKENFILVYSTTMTFLLYDLMIVYMKDNSVYLSAYDFIQPEANLVSNPKSLDPKYLSENYMKILEEDLEKFKSIRDNYKVNPSSTIYHKSYHEYVNKNIQVLCRYLYKKEDC